MHNNLVTINKNRYMSEAGNPPVSVSPSECIYGRAENFFLSQAIATWNGLTAEAVSAETVDGFKSKI